MESITLNLIPMGWHPTCHVSQNDNERNVHINIVDGSVLYNIKEDDVITLNVRKPDDSVVTAEVEATAGNHYVEITITDEMCDLDGRNTCELRITNGNTRLSTSNFYMEVEVDPTANPAPTPPAPARRGGLTTTNINIISTTYETA